jgi:Tol biopolymer transport system component
MAIGTQGNLTGGGWLALAVAGVTLAIGVQGAQAAFPGANGRIAFAVDRWGPPADCRPEPHGCEAVPVSARIETVLASGRGRRALYAFPGPTPLAQYSGPAWSPSGRLLAFQREGRLAIIRHDGTGLRSLPQLSGRDSEPAWSPDGRRLAFVGARPCVSCRRLFTVRTDGTDLRRVTVQATLWPAWSVTGRLAFVNYNDRYGKAVGVKDGLYTIRPDGSRLHRLFGRYWGTGQEPDWSPDGSRIAFHARGQIFTLGADGRGLRRLTDFKSNRVISGPVWSPDGEYVAFIRGDLYLMRSDGRALRRLVKATRPDFSRPDWSFSEFSAPSWQPLPR